MTLRINTRALLLAALAVPAAVQAQTIQPQPVYVFEQEAPSPFAPPVWSPQRQALIGVTTAGGDPYEMVAFEFNGVGTPGPGPSGRAYAIGIDGSAFASASLGGVGGLPITNVVVTPSGDAVAGSSFAAWIDPASGVAKRVGTLFRLDAQLAATSHRPADISALGQFQMRGQLTVDAQGNIYGPDGYGDPTRKRLVRMTPAGTVETVVDFEQYRKPFSIARNGTPNTWPSKGSIPYAQIWSARDDALYLVSSVHGWGGGTKPDCLPEAPEEGLSKPDCDDGTPLTGHLVRIKAEALARGVVEDDIEVLFHFTQKTGGAPTSNDGSLAALVEDGDFLYGTSLAGPDAAPGTAGIWRIRKSGLADGATPKDSFDFVHVFANGEDAVDIDGRQPHGPLVRAADGAIYGTTRGDSRAMADRTGTIYRIVPGTDADRSDDRYERVHLFDGALGTSPMGLSIGPAIEGEQHVIGVTSAGAATVFGFTLAVPAGELTLSSSAGSASVDIGATVRLSWSAQGLASCEAASSETVGDWQGAKDPEGGEHSIAAVEGDIEYRLECLDLGGRSVSDSVRVRAVAAEAPQSDGGGGGGAFGAWLLAGLGLAAMARRRHRHRD